MGVRILDDELRDRGSELILSVSLKSATQFSDNEVAQSTLQDTPAISLVVPS